MQAIDKAAYWFALGLLCALTSADAGVGASGTGGGRVYGEITDFGSVWVNGVKFSTAGANIRINGIDNRPETELRRGMAVRVEGSIDVDGVNGSATLIEYVGDLEGAVDAPATIAGLNGTFTVHGLTVRTSERTQYETGTALANLLAGDLVEVSGLFNNADGSYSATRIEKLAAYRKTELRGYIGNVTATTFSIGNLTVDYQAVLATHPNDIPAGGLQNGMYLEVKGTVAPVAGQMIASRLSTELDVLATRDTALGYVQGIIASTNPNSFRMGTLQINLTGATVFDGAPAGALRDGLQVYASGPVAGGVMTAAYVTVPVSVTKVVSVKTHGNSHTCEIPIAIDRDVSGEVETEPRNAGVEGHKLRFHFDGPVTSVGSITSKGSNGSSDTGLVGTAVISGSTVEVPITSVPDNRRAKVTLNNVNGYGRKVSVSLGFLSGDSKRRGSIDDGTLGAVKARGGHGVDDTNCAFDLNLSGTISAADIAAIKARRNTTLAP